VVYWAVGERKGRSGGGIEVLGREREKCQRKAEHKHGRQGPKSPGEEVKHVHGSVQKMFGIIKLKNRYFIYFQKLLRCMKQLICSFLFLVVSCSQVF
jgi:hypothetical protein